MKLSTSKCSNVNYLAKIVQIDNFTNHIAPFENFGTVFDIVGIVLTF